MRRKVVTNIKDIKDGEEILRKILLNCSSRATEMQEDQKQDGKKNSLQQKTD
jgi:hypothetical protein